MTVRPFFTAALAVALCIPAAGPAWAATAPDPCTTVAKSDAAKALGAPVTSVKPMTAGPSRSCGFRGVKPLQSAVVTAFRWDSPADARARFSDMVKQTAAAFALAPAKVGGIGDEAVVINSTVYARKDTAAYVFNVFGIRTPALTARAVALAKATMARAH